MADNRGPSNVTVENAKIAFRNFSGKEGDYNRAGDRNFCLLLDADLAKAMDDDGWNIKQLKPREEGDVPQDYVQVAVSYKYRDPRCVMITGKGKTTLPEDMLVLFDWCDIENVDVIIRPYPWAVSGKSGIKAYLQAIYITVREDDLERKYADVPDTGQNLLGAAPELLQIESGGRIPVSEDEIVIEDDGPPWS